MTDVRMGLSEAETPRGARTGLLIDWGGVLTTNLFASFHAYCVRDGDRSAAAGGALPRGSRVPRAVDRAGEGRDRRAGVRAALRRAARRRARRADRRAVRRAWRRTLPMIEAVRRAHAAGIRTALVSNSWGVHRYPHELFDELFDGVVISGEEGIRKPSRRMYELGAERAGRAARASACTSTICPSTSRLPRSSAWRPCTTRAPRRRSPSSNGCSGFAAAETAVRASLAACRAVQELEQRPPAAARSRGLVGEHVQVLLRLSASVA